MKAKTVPIVFLLAVLLMGTLATAVKPARAAPELNVITVPDD